MLNEREFKAMEEWAHRLAERVIEKEFVGVPPEVQALACVYHLGKLNDIHGDAMLSQPVMEFFTEDEEGKVIYVKSHEGTYVVPAIRYFGPN